MRLANWFRTGLRGGESVSKDQSTLTVPPKHSRPPGTIHSRRHEKKGSSPFKDDGITSRTLPTYFLPSLDTRTLMGGTSLSPLLSNRSRVSRQRDVHHTLEVGIQWRRIFTKTNSSGYRSNSTGIKIWNRIIRFYFQDTAYFMHEWICGSSSQSSQCVHKIIWTPFPGFQWYR